MSYNYKEERERLLTVEFVPEVVRLYVKARVLLEQSGAFTREMLLKEAALTNSWMQMAAVDWVIEIGGWDLLRSDCAWQFGTVVRPPLL